MKRNPVIPFAIIAVMGILAMIVISSIGVNQKQAIQDAEENGGEQQEETASASPEEMFQAKCASCHGGDLSGGVGPALQEVGSRYSAEEIQDIIINGKGSQMPPGLYTGEQAAKLAQWLAEKK
ncbi:cytochrome c550 [Halobacillus amylolyticus]|uniref:Cytochrome c n=1 Tax=Halobacillus amylolyticus TaxID=2932259 RepID=A0ABY4HC88_9BACI|nr:cytochrome c [Halobacillus amylolyticus]UOR12287.1 cytochrome c [Halobacillus amylolyticus]